MVLHRCDEPCSTDRATDQRTSDRDADEEGNSAAFENTLRLWECQTRVSLPTSIEAGTSEAAIPLAIQVYLFHREDLVVRRACCLLAG